jgi:hypothetical protein
VVQEKVFKDQSMGLKSLQDRAALEAQLRQQGFGQAQQLAQQQFTNQMQLAQQQPALAQQQISNLGALGTIRSCIQTSAIRCSSISCKRSSIRTIH